MAARSWREGWRRDLLNAFAHLDDLHGTRARMRFDAPPLGPGIGSVVVIDIGDKHAVARLMHDKADVAVDARRPKVGVLGIADPVHLEPVAGRVHLQIEDARLHRFLVKTGQAIEGGGNRIDHAGRVEMQPDLRRLAIVQARAGERKCNSARVHCDPTPSPLLSDVSRGARAAGRVKHEIAGVGGHKDTAFCHFDIGLDHVRLIASVKAPLCICPMIGHGQDRIAVHKEIVGQAILTCQEQSGPVQTLKVCYTDLPVVRCAGMKRLSLKREWDCASGGRA